jgi:DNA mismatch repair ATPase MutS
MKKDMPHAGFPEAAFQRYAEILVDLGYKVARIEQVLSRNKTF